MKTTVEIADSLLQEARAHARRRKMPLRQFLEEALRQKIQLDQQPLRKFQLHDAARDLGAMRVPDSWPALRRVIYEGRGE